jgi:hypothetical protein
MCDPRHFLYACVVRRTPKRTQYCDNAQCACSADTTYLEFRVIVHAIIRFLVHYYHPRDSYYRTTFLLPQSIFCHDETFSSYGYRSCCNRHVSLCINDDDNNDWGSFFRDNVEILGGTFSTKCELRIFFKADLVRTRSRWKYCCGRNEENTEFSAEEHDGHHRRIVDGIILNHSNHHGYHDSSRQIRGASQQNEGAELGCLHYTKR